MGSSRAAALAAAAGFQDGPVQSGPLIEVEGARFAYPRQDGWPVEALKGVDLRVEAGEFVAVVGRNGSGKSTLARLLNALLLPTEGRVVVAGRDTRDPQALWEIRRTVGMVFQNPDNQLVATTVEEDVAFGPENLGLPPEEIRRRVDEALQALNIAHLRHEPPHRLSGGQKQRVAIAGALAMRPACVVMDEPTSMLDPEGRAEVMAAVRWLTGQLGVAVVLITHRMTEAAAAGRVVVLSEGRVALEGSPRQVFSQVQAIRELHLEPPPMAELVASLSRRYGVQMPEGILTVEEMAERLCPSSSGS